MTKIGERKVALVRRRGGTFKQRALRLDAGNFAWPSEALTRKSRIIGVTYNATSNELVRTNTLVKSSIVQIDAAPYRLWYEQHYGVQLGKKKTAAKPKAGEEATKDEAAKTVGKSALKRRADHLSKRVAPLDAHLAEQFLTGRLYANISSRPGQDGVADGYILEGKELDFYLKKMQKKKGTTAK